MTAHIFQKLQLFVAMDCNLVGRTWPMVEEEVREINAKV